MAEERWSHVMRREIEERVEIGNLRIEKREETFPLLLRVNGNSSMSPVTSGLKHRFRIQFSRQMKRDAYFGEIFVFKNVLYGTYVATPGVHSPGYCGSESRHLELGAILQFLRNLVSPFHISLPLLVFRALCVLLCAVAPGITAGQDSPAKEKQEGTVQAQMRNVTYHFSETVAVEIRSLKGELVPLGKNEFPVFDDKDSFNLRISAAEIAIDSSNLANVLNSYVFARPHSPLTELSIRVEKGHLKVKGKLHDKGDIPFATSRRSASRQR